MVYDEVFGNAVEKNVTDGTDIFGIVTIQDEKTGVLKLQLIDRTV